MSHFVCKNHWNNPFVRFQDRNTFFHRFEVLDDCTFVHEFDYTMHYTPSILANSTNRHQYYTTLNILFLAYHCLRNLFRFGLAEAASHMIVFEKSILNSKIIIYSELGH